ncbi:F-box only protein 15 [Xyrichtys novacula]|uniref:F-box only protein 15 n=1 Tax=Xyrichtys novacula TaxID=13765 RepID=A0AAV1H8C8_XYRNO|nr:F-box only protein 15 [Xyrichtys novacula]
MTHVSKLFYQLSNDNILWKKIHNARFVYHKSAHHKHWYCSIIPEHGSTVGFWRRHHFRTVAGLDIQLVLREPWHISHRTGLLMQIEQILRKLHVTFELTVSTKSRQEDTYEPRCSHVGETFVTLLWDGAGRLPDYQEISTLQLHGVKRVALNCPGLKAPGLRSCMEEIDMHALVQSAQVIGKDQLVELKLLQPGIIIGVRKDQCSVAFIMFTLHFHMLEDRSIWKYFGWPPKMMTKAPFDDTDPEYGLHGYHLHIVLHNTECKIMSRSFPRLFYWRTQINEGLIQLSVIGRGKLWTHTPLSGSITLPWRCEALQGTVEGTAVARELSSKNPGGVLQ